MSVNLKGLIYRQFLAKLSDGFARNAEGQILHLSDMSIEASWSHGSFVSAVPDRTPYQLPDGSRPSELIVDFGTELSHSRHALLVACVLLTLGG